MSARARFVGSDVVIRYLTDDVPEQAELAEAIIEGDELLVNSTILGECGFRLTRLYGFSRRQVVDALVEFLLRENVAMADIPKELAANALLSVRNSKRMSMGDALIIACMQAAGVSEIYSFDRGLKAEGITVLDRPHLT